jgi:hypothetical protein
MLDETRRRVKAGAFSRSEIPLVTPGIRPVPVLDEKKVVFPGAVCIITFCCMGGVTANPFGCLRGPGS